MIRTLRIPDETYLNRPISDLLRFTVAEATTVAGPADVVRRAVQLARRPSAKPGGDAAAVLPEGVFDFAEMAHRALGTHAETRSPAERAEFTRLLGGQVTRTYRAWFAGTAGRVVLSGGVADGAHSIVWSTARRGSRSRRIEHRLHEVQGAWLINDLLLEGESLVQPQRERMGRSIQESSWEETLWPLRLHDVEVASGTLTRPGS